MELGQHIKGRVIDMKDEHEFRIVITPFCNYRCFFCHSEGFIKESTPLLLSPADYGFVAKAAKELWGWDTLTITGGEPLISPIYRETCEAIAKEGVRITTVTNASLISSPRKILAHNSQINVSLHSMDPDVYRRITCITYPLNQVIDTIISVRSFYPEMAIHLNATVIRGVNDKPEDMDKLINFATRIEGEAKFIDLASSNKQLIVPCEEIEERLVAIGFSKVDEGKWRSIFERGSEHTSITRCGFAEQNSARGDRNLFLNPDGTVASDDDRGKLSMSLLREIHERDLDSFAKKVEWYFPPAKRI